MDIDFPEDVRDPMPEGWTKRIDTLKGADKFRQKCIDNDRYPPRKIGRLVHAEFYESDIETAHVFVYESNWVCVRIEEEWNWWARVEDGELIPKGFRDWKQPPEDGDE